ncbi:hypothetical protein [Nonomuraea sp. NPDC049695]|uniref:hypothetical protein n=1 Tax=Nonomuraea sp. NPDC049695 TaxID=3154734 RepID=UPI0034253DE0
MTADEVGLFAGLLREIAVGRTTWHQLSVNRRPVLIRHPARPVTVSPRAAATDTAGNTVEQTVVNAYRSY